MKKGWSVDTRAVEIMLADFAHAPEHWTPFEIKTDLALQDTFKGWWHVLEGFVLTLAASGAELPEMEPLFPESILVAQRAAAENGALHEQRHGILHRRIAQATRHHTRHAQGH